MIINLLCKALIAILDILLLDFYLKNIYPNIYTRKFKRVQFIIYFIILISMLSIKSIKTTFLIDFLVIIILTVIFKTNFLPTIYKLINFYLLKYTVTILLFLAFSFIFDHNLLITYINYSFPYILLTNCVAKLSIYTILILTLKLETKINIRNFKTLCIFVFAYFSITFILNNNTLFRVPSIARTYIFTVVISIVALICFDRMQTKYEADKHKKEAIIQNMVKEEEFIQQLDKQQSKIREINHNLNHILTILQSDLQQGKYKEAQEYIEKNLDIHIKEYQALVHTGMTMIDSTINHQIYRMKEQNIEYKEDITKILHLGCIGPEDLSLILGLALDNAREACEKVEHQRQISLRLQSKQTHLIIHITNSIPKGSHPHFHKTSKKDSIAHGYGVKVIKEIAEKYHGDVKYEVQEDCVVLRIVLQK